MIMSIMRLRNLNIFFFVCIHIGDRFCNLPVFEAYQNVCQSKLSSPLQRIRNKYFRKKLGYLDFKSLTRLCFTDTEQLTHSKCILIPFFSNTNENLNFKTFFFV